MKIGFLTYNIDPRMGWGRYASELINGVKSAGHQTVILKEQDDGFEGASVLGRKFSAISSAIRSVKHLKDCDVIHALDVYPFGIIAFLVNLFMNKPLVITAQGTYSIAPFHHRSTSFISKLVLKKAKYIIAISHYTKKKLLEKVDLNNIVVINHGIDLKKFKERSDKNEQNYLIGVGALKHRKGYHISIQAFASAKKNFPDLKYKIVGDQSDKIYFDYLKKIVKDNNIEESVEFLNNISDDHLAELYNNAKVFMLTSVNYKNHFEGFGLVFLEAASFGLPVIGTLDNGIEDAVKNYYNGILVSQNNVKETSRTIENILSDNNLLDKFSNNSYSWAREHNMGNVIEKYINIYKQCL